MLILHLPYPPSTNTYWRHPTRGKLAGRHLISEAGRKYRLDCHACVLEHGVRRPLEGRLTVTILAKMPDRRRRDLDNILKALFDAMTHAGVWLDDEQIDEIIIRRNGMQRGGEVCVFVDTMDDGE